MVIETSQKLERMCYSYTKKHIKLERTRHFDEFIARQLDCLKLYRRIISWTVLWVVNLHKDNEKKIPTKFNIFMLCRRKAIYNDSKICKYIFFPWRAAVRKNPENLLKDFSDMTSHEIFYIIFFPSSWRRALLTHILLWRESSFIQDCGKL